MPGDTEVRRQPPDPGERRTLLAQEPALLPTEQAPQGEPSYYNISPLKPPVWSGEIAAYFFLGGLSAGAYLVARLADRFGGEGYRPVARAGTGVAALALLPCAPLLIMDLGDPSRFHHMLRVFKPHSPMNLGAWTLTGYSGAATLAVLREWLRGDRSEAERSAAGGLMDSLLVTVTDAAGVPLALLLAGYTGVLLSCTATPVWSKSPWLGPLFSASAVATGASAVHLALEAWQGEKGSTPAEDSARESLGRVDTLATVVEALAMAGFLSSKGALARPLTEGPVAPAFWGGALGLAASEALKLLAGRGSGGRWARVGASLLGLAGAFAWRWALVRGGPPSAEDPEAARRVSRPGRENPAGRQLTPGAARPHSRVPEGSGGTDRPRR